ncbi:hypothetical protein [Oenococcus sicerae]|uniref:Uncharacterized protein n=1 Tax=Oenococcus sicerae TaxID=2203724 RepID=A0AAJ1VLU5_9LACO|nr:hypothetical protein [Oenococcus sicerae]MDN6899858.1 hypothetical protein [Oenococcus sicerae]
MNDYYKELQNNCFEGNSFSKYGSWLLYKIHAENEDEIKPGILSQAEASIKPFLPDLENANKRYSLINHKAIILGLNWSNPGKINGDWTNFHADWYSHGHDYRLAYIFSKTEYDGSYITDLIKNLPVTDSGIVYAGLAGKHPSKKGKRETQEQYAERLQNIADLEQDHENILQSNATALAKRN